MSIPRRTMSATKLRRKFGPRPTISSCVPLLLHRRPSVEMAVPLLATPADLRLRAHLLEEDTGNGKATAASHSLGKLSLKGLNFHGLAMAGQASMGDLPSEPALHQLRNRCCRLVTYPMSGKRRGGTHLLAPQSAPNFLTRRALGRR